MTNAANAKPRETVVPEEEFELEQQTQPETPPQAEPEPEDQTFDDPVPSWFTRRMTENVAGDVQHAPQFRSSYQPLTQAQQSEAQDAYRQRLEERFRLAQSMATHHQPLPSHEAPNQTYAASGFPQRPVPPQSPTYDHAYDHGYMEPTPRRPSKNPLGVSVPVALFLLTVASFVGATGGYISANPGVAANMMPTSFAALWPFGGGEEKRVATTDDAAKKDMPSARVNVADVEGAVNAPIPLDISAFPAEPGTPLALKISGLPNDAYLTKGQQVAEGEWLVRAEDIRSAELVVKSSEAPELGLLVTALEAKSGAAAAPAQSMKVALNLDAVPAPGLTPPPAPEEQVAQEQTLIQPVSAPPGEVKADNLPRPIPTPNALLVEEATNYVEKGEMLLKVGDIIAARQFFIRAYELKSPDGAYGVARTYDPAVYRDLNVQGLKPNAEKAMEWYGKAAAQGHEAAQAALAQPPQ
jgi:TPR repeat protein